jgi:hypothetical protein
MVACLIVTVLAGIRWYPRAREHALMLWWQRKCMNHPRPVDRVVYTNDASRSDALLRDGGYRVMDGATRSTFLVPSYWSDLYAHVSPPGLKSQGTVFLGRMTTRSGKVRLVAIDMVLEDPTRDDVLLIARVIEPGSALRRPRLISTIGGKFLSFGLTDRPVTPGQIDPQDPTHLVLFDGRIDGWLGEDGGVTFRPRDTGPQGSPPRDPLTRPVPSSQGSPRSSAGPETRRSARPAAR